MSFVLPARWTVQPCSWKYHSIAFRALVGPSPSKVQITPKSISCRSTVVIPSHSIATITSYHRPVGSGAKSISTARLTHLLPCKAPSVQLEAQNRATAQVKILILFTSNAAYASQHG